MRRDLRRLLAVFCLTAAFGASGQKLSFGGPTPAVGELSFDDVLNGKVRLTFGRPGPIELYPVESSAAERVKSACSVTVPPSLVWETRPGGECPALFETFWKDGALDLAISPAGASTFALLKYKPVPDYPRFGGSPTVVAVPQQDPDDHEKPSPPDWSKPAIPEHVSATAETRCFVRLDAWHELSCRNRLVDPKAASAAIEAAWGAGETIELFAHVKDQNASAGAWRRFAFVLKPKSAPKPKDPPTPEVLDPLEQRCSLAAGGLEDVSADFYVLCADVFADRSGVLALACSGPNKGRACKETGDLLRGNRELRAFVWHEAKKVPSITLGGTPGATPPVYGGELKAAGLDGGRAPLPEDVQLSRRNFSARVPGTVTFSASVVAGQVTLKAEQAFTVEAVYRFALRFGVAFSSAPLARAYGVQTYNGQRYSAVLAGEGTGLISSSLVAGITWFPTEVTERSADLRFGLGARIGVLNLTSNEVKSLDSLLLGFEACFGVDFSVGLFFGVARSDVPRAGFEPGRLVLTDKLELEPALTPTVAVVLNFTPGFLTKLGIAK